MSDALKEGYRRVAQMREIAGISDDIAAWFPIGFELGSEWQKEQDPSDAECIYVLNAINTPLGEEPTQNEWARAAINRCRDALIKAKESR